MINEIYVMVLSIGIFIKLFLDKFIESPALVVNDRMAKDNSL